MHQDAKDSKKSVSQTEGQHWSKNKWIQMAHAKKKKEKESWKVTSLH